MDIGQEIPGRGMKKRDATKLIHNIYTFAKMRWKKGTNVQFFVVAIFTFFSYFSIVYQFICHFTRFCQVKFSLNTNLGCVKIQKKNISDLDP